MEYKKIVAVTGMPGLFEVLSSKSDGAVVRSLDEGSTKFVSSRIHNLTQLESIEIYTTGDNVGLSDVFNAIKQSKEPLPDVKDNKALSAYFKKVYPEMDFDRVYASDMKKMVTWFNALEEHKIDFTVKEEVAEDEIAEEPIEANDNAAKETNEPEETATIATEETKEVKPKRTRKKKTEG